MSQFPSSRLLASSVLVAAATISSAQTIAKATTKPTTAVHHTTTATKTTAATCVKLPEISPKVPALPAGLPCVKHLYSITVKPAATLDDVSPIASEQQIRKTLGMEPTTFSLDYVDIKAGTGELAAPNKWYTIHYTGYLLDGTKFDSSVDRGVPIDIAYGQHQVIPGWDTGFDGMRVGGKRRLFIPYQLAYGANGKPPIPPRAELIFDVELVAQSDVKPAPKAPPAPTGASARPATNPTPTDSTSPQPKPATQPTTSPNPNSK